MPDLTREHLEAALEAKRAQHAETLGMLEHAYEAIAVTRPLLGYVVVYVEDGRPVHGVEKGMVFADRDTAAFYAAEDSTLALFELREVQP